MARSAQDFALPEQALSPCANMLGGEDDLSTRASATSQRVAIALQRADDLLERNDDLSTRATATSQRVAVALQRADDLLERLGRQNDAEAASSVPLPSAAQEVGPSRPSGPRGAYCAAQDRAPQRPQTKLRPNPRAGSLGTPLWAPSGADAPEAARATRSGYWEDLCGLRTPS